MKFFVQRHRSIVSIAIGDIHYLHRRFGDTTDFWKIKHRIDNNL
ncbi:MAG: hypothetical protein ABW155_04270 [Candidatus Thiodiazotropha sp.]